MIAELWVLVAGEIRMQLRQRMAVVMFFVMPLVGVPMGLLGIDSYLGTIGEVEALTRPDPKPGDPGSGLPVAVPPEAVGWIVPADGLRVVPPSEADAELTLDGRTAVVRFSPSFRSSAAQKRLAGVVERRQRQLRNAALDAAGIPAQKADGLTWQATDTAPPGRVELSRAGGWITPMLLLLLLANGLFTALDLLTGERERGTLETLLASRADRRVVLGAKALVVLGATLTT
ncbi:MAG: ABC transporter permease subunit, partial [Myxococcota bacterium]